MGPIVCADLEKLKNRCAFKGQPTIYAMEINQLKTAGYEKVGDYYVHADNLGTFKP